MLFFSVLFFLGCAFIFYAVYIMVKVQKKSNTEAVTPPRNKSRNMLVVGIIFFIVSGIGIFLTDFFKPEPPDAWKTRDNSIDAYVMMQDFVKRRLVSPSSAKFPYTNDKDITIEKDGYEYVIFGYVDSQNVFGAMVRNYYSGVVKQIDDINWELVTLDIGDE